MLINSIWQQLMIDSDSALEWTFCPQLAYEWIESHLTNRQQTKKAATTFMTEPAEWNTGRPLLLL